MSEIKTPAAWDKTAGADGIALGQRQPFSPSNSIWQLAGWCVASDLSVIPLWRPPVLMAVAEPLHARQTCQRL